MPFGIVKETIIHWDDTSSDYQMVYAEVTLEGKAQGNKLLRDEYTGVKEEAILVIELRARVIQNKQIITSLIAEYAFALFYTPDTLQYEELQQVSEYARTKFSDHFNSHKGAKIELLTIPAYLKDLEGLKVLYEDCLKKKH